MKCNKSLSKAIFILIILILCQSCFIECSNGGSLTQQSVNKMYIGIVEPNFVGDFLSFWRANFLDIKIEDLGRWLFDEPLIFNEEIYLNYVYLTNTYLPKLRREWVVNYFESNFNADGSYQFFVDTNFVEVDNDRWSDFRVPIGFSHFDSQYFFIELKRNTHNNIRLVYNADFSTSIHFTLNVETETLNSAQRTVNGNSPPPLNLPVGVLIHPRSVPNNIPSSINIVVMAEGYRADQIHFFRNYVENAFAGVANFNLNSNDPDDNNFFQRNWENNNAENWKANINVFMYETISPQAGIGDNIQSYFNVHPQFSNRTDTVQMRSVVNATASKMGTPQLPDNVDAYIILVNDSSISSYTLPFNAAVSWRRGQPANYIIIQAPAGYNVNAGNFHNYVETHKIGQLAGTAMAGLMPEHNVQLTRYNSSLRNISQVENASASKWSRLWAVEDFRATNNNDHRLSERGFPNSRLGNIQLYSPSHNCIMRGNNGGATPTQFCPVCEYHLEGSFRTRMGIIPAQNPLYDGSNISSYEWQGFSIEDFAEGNYVIVPEPPVRFVVVGNDGNMARSSDGINWSQITVGTETWINVTHSDGRWVASGKNGNMTHSTDGINWIITKHSEAWNAFTYGNNRFVAVGRNGIIAHSTDGINWTQMTLGNINWESVTYGNGRFVAVGGKGIIVHSTNGINWTQINVGNEDWLIFTYNNGRFIAVNRNYIMAHSTDGINWTQLNLNSGFWSDVTYGNDRFVLVGLHGRIIQSADGINWTGAIIDTEVLSGVTYGNGKLVAVGINGTVAYSTDGINWTQISVGTDRWIGAAFAGN